MWGATRIGRISTALGPRQPTQRVVTGSVQSTFLGGSRCLTASLEPVQPGFVEGSLLVECAAKRKLKTRKAAAKRFKVTAGGKVMHRHRNKQHLNEKKRRKNLLRLKGESQISSNDRENILKCLPYSGV